MPLLIDLHSHIISLIYVFHFWSYIILLNGVGPHRYI